MKTDAYACVFTGLDARTEQAGQSHSRGLSRLFALLCVLSFRLCVCPGLRSVGHVLPV